MIENNIKNNEFQEKIKKSMEQNKNKQTFELAKILEKQCKRESLDNTRKRREIKRKTILKYLKEAHIKDKTKKEEKIYIILDNYSVHKSFFIKEISEILNISLIPLPPYSPHLNPIEQVWKSIKRETKHTYIKSKEYLESIVVNSFNELIKNQNFTKEWEKTFIPKVW